MRHAREKRAKEARDLKGEKFKTNMAARGFFRSTKLLSYFVRSLPTSVYLMYSTDTVYAGDRNENKEDDSRRHKLTHRNEKYNRYEISRQQKKRELKKIAPLLLRTPKLVFMEAVKVMIFE